jgi:hypothetical protein
VSVVIASQRVRLRRPDDRLREDGVGWPKRPDAKASGGVPTMNPHPEIRMVGTAQERLCPPYGLARAPRNDDQIAFNFRYANHTIFKSSQPSRNLEIWVSPNVRAL